MMGAYLKNLEDKTLKQSFEGKGSCQRKQFTTLDQFHVTIRRFGTVIENQRLNVHFDFSYCLFNLE